MEPWLRGTLTGIPVVHRAVLHSLEMAEEDLAKWCGGLNDLEIHARPFEPEERFFYQRKMGQTLSQ